VFIGFTEKSEFVHKRLHLKEITLYEVVEFIRNLLYICGKKNNMKQLYSIAPTNI
jgi:hypothetical protein